jgi:hypothetical protein
MSKPSRKNPPSPPPPAPQPKARGKTSLAVAGVGLAALAIAAVTVVQRDRIQPDAPAEAAAGPVSAPAASAQPADPTPAEGRPADPQPAVVLGPHPQKDYPPLNLPAYALARSPEVITATYRFAAEHPEVLSYIPCFCGCERSGHRDNEDCFVQKRGANGDVTEWTEHGMECSVCLDVAQQAMQMHASGASVRDIRAAVEKKWATQAAQSHTHTPTADPPR